MGISQSVHEEAIAQLRAENAQLRADHQKQIEQLRADHQKQIEQLRAENEQLRAKIEQMQAENEQLRAKLFTKPTVRRRHNVVKHHKANVYCVRQ